MDDDYKGSESQDAMIHFLLWAAAQQMPEVKVPVRRSTEGKMGKERNVRTGGSGLRGSILRFTVDDEKILAR